MTPEQVTQDIQDIIARLWPNNLLTPDQQTFVEEIFRKVWFSPDLDNSLDYPHWQSQVTALEQELTQRLAALPSSAETSVADENPATLRFALLWLYQSAGEVAETKFNNLPARLELYQRGLDLTAHWQVEHESDPRVREQVLKLHVNLGVSFGQMQPPQLAEKIRQYQRGLELTAHWQVEHESDPRVRELVLRLHFNLGVSFGQTQPPQLAEAIRQYQRGLDLALPRCNNPYCTPESLTSRCNNPYCTPESLTSPPWLVKDTGENDPGVRFQLLRLYESSAATWGNLQHSHQVLALLPMVGLWTWAQAGKVSKDNIDLWANVLDHWSRYYLTISPFFPNVTQAFQSLFHTLLDWHKDGMSNSLRLFKFVTTEKLLALSESLYALAQVEENQRTHIVYQELQNLANSSFVADARAFPQQQQARYQQLIPLWQQLSLSPSSLAAPLECNKNYCTKEPLECNKNYCTKEPLECNKNYCTKEPLECNKNYCTELRQLPWWKRLWHHRTITQLRDQIDAYQQQQRQHDAAPHHPDWQTAVAKVDTAILDWLVHNLHQQNPTLPGDGLEELSSILLGILLASSPTPVADTLKQWQEIPPWQTSAQMQTALAPTRWERFIRLQEPLLYMWINWLRDAHLKSATMQRLNIVLETENFAQPELQKWLQEFSQGHLDSLQRNLNSAWERAQEHARNLADRLTWIDFTQVLAMVILGDTKRQVRLSLQQWLTDGVDTTTAPVLETLAKVKHRFNQAVSIYKPVHLPLEQTVYEWAKVRLKEILKEEDHTGGREQEIWETLETARIGLTSLAFQPPSKWEETLGRQLWEALRDSINWIRQGNLPADDAPWRPLEVWLEAFDKWLCNNSYGTPDGAHEALVQPFFDPTQQRLRILWLDNKGGLTLRELPDDCAPQSLWENNSPVGVINQWTRGVKTLQQPQPRGGVPGPLSPFPECAQMMQSVPVQTLAKTLADWANTADLKQLTIIWPAPLGQLPWETLPRVEQLFAREISIGHWLATKHPRGREDQDERKVWIVSDPSGQTQCMLKEQQWLARQFDARKVTVEAPCLSMFDALHQLRTHRQTYFIAHGQYDRVNPLSSRLSLHDSDQRYLPLWLCSLLPLSTELLVLSACESNLYGQETQGLLAPIGIGPSLAAAGVQTVVGTLWPCDGLAALCFVYYLYKFAQETPKAGEPKLPWHHLVARARKAVRDLTREELKRLAETEWRLTDDHACRDTAGHYLTVVARPGIRPFQDLSYWGGFTVMGKMVQ